MRRFLLALLLSMAVTPAFAEFVGGLNPYGDNFLALRTGPGTRFPMILPMGPGTHVTILGAQGSWYYLRLDDGTRGWASSRYIFGRPPPPRWAPPPPRHWGPPPPPPPGGWRPHY